MSWVDELLARFPTPGAAEAEFVDELARILAAPFSASLAAETAAAGAPQPLGSIAFGMDPRALAWARAHAADLITEIDDVTRDWIRARVTEALEAGAAPRNLGSTILGAVQDMAPYRAERIARTETAHAMNQGTLAGYGDAGVQYVEVLDGPGCLPSGHDDGAPLPGPGLGVQEGAQANGQIWTVAEAAARPLGHPNCVRAFAALVLPPPAEEA